MEETIFVCWLAFIFIVFPAWLSYYEIRGKHDNDILRR